MAELQAPPALPSQVREPLGPKRARALLVIALGLAAASAQAQDEAPSTCPEALTEQLRPRLPKALALQVQELIGADCRPFPGDPKRRLAAVVYGPPEELRAAQAESGQALPISLVLAVLPARGHKVLQQLRLHVEEDALVQVSGRNFVWDPAVYRLGPGRLVAGLRFQSSAREASCPDQRWGDQLALLHPEDRSLRVVFSAAMQGQVGVEGPLCGNTAQWLQLQRALAVDHHRTGDWADLLLIERAQLEQLGDAPAKPQPRRTLRYRYNGQLYQADPKGPGLEQAEPGQFLPWQDMATRRP